MTVKVRLRFKPLNGGNVHANRARVLVNTPDLALGGGVSAYWRALRAHLPEEIEYFTSGARATERGGWTARILRSGLDYGAYILKVAFGRHSILQLNPSVGMKALLRDGIFVLIGKLFRKKIVVFFHGWDPQCEEQIRQKFLWLFRTVYGRANASIVLSSQFREHLQEFGYTGKIFVETTAVEEGLVDIIRRAPAQERFRVLFLARIEKDKGIFEAIEAHRLAIQKNKEIELIVAGDGPSLQHAREYTELNGIANVSFWGHVTGARKVEAFVTADCYVFPSYHEGMPISVLEAMACGLPVITRPVGGLRDIFKHGEMGFLEESTCPAAFAQLMTRLADDPALARRMGEHNRSVAKRYFLPSRVAARMQEIHREVLTQ
jgi:glycosyltransferase involved in cell wall biosynthesis